MESQPGEHPLHYSQAALGHDTLAFLDDHSLPSDPNLGASTAFCLPGPDIPWGPTVPTSMTQCGSHRHYRAPILLPAATQLARPPNLVTQSTLYPPLKVYGDLGKGAPEGVSSPLWEAVSHPVSQRSPCLQDPAVMVYLRQPALYLSVGAILLCTWATGVVRLCHPARSWCSRMHLVMAFVISPQLIAPSPRARAMRSLRPQGQPHPGRLTSEVI